MLTYAEFELRVCLVEQFKNKIVMALKILKNTQNLLECLFYIKSTVSLPKFPNGSIREPPKKQNCPVSETPDKQIILLDQVLTKLSC